MPTPIEINGWSAYNHVSSSGSTKKSLLMINPSPDFLSRILYTWLVIFGAFFITKREGLLFCRSLPKESRKKNKLYNTSTQPRNPISIGWIAYYSRCCSTLASSDFPPVACINQIFLFVLLLIKDPLLLHWKKIWIESTSHRARVGVVYTTQTMLGTY